MTRYSVRRITFWTLVICLVSGVVVVVLPPSVGYWPTAKVESVRVLAPRSPLDDAASRSSLDGSASFGVEFDGPKGTGPDLSVFEYDVGGGGWGNHERQIYTSSRKNSQLDGRGNLVIRAIREGSEVTSARLTTRGRFSFTYGTLSARLRIPAGDGLHPSFWLLGADIDSVGFPACGELDVIETINAASSWHTAVHGPDADGRTYGIVRDGAVSGSLADRFRTYSVTRSPGRVTMAVDGIVVSTYTRADLPPGAPWVFDKPMYVVFDIAAGGEWPGPITPETPDISTMAIDWMRFWK